MKKRFLTYSVIFTLLSLLSLSEGEAQTISKWKFVNDGYHNNGMGVRFIYLWGK